MRSMPGSDRLSSALQSLNHLEPSMSENHSDLICDLRRQAAELRNLTIDNAAFNSGLTRARSAPRRSEKPDGQGPSGGKGGKIGAKGGKGGKGKAGRSNSSGPPARAVSRTSGGGLHIQSQIAKVKSSASRAIAAPVHLRERSSKPSEAERQAAAGAKETGRHGLSVSGTFEPTGEGGGSEEVEEIPAPTIEAKFAVFDYKALKSEVTKLKKSDLQTAIFKLFSHRDDFCTKFINLSASHMKERIMMEILRLDQTDTKQDRELGWAAREAMGSAFSKARKTKMVSKDEAAEYLYKTDHFGSAATITPPPGIVFDEGRGNTPVQVVAAKSGPVLEQLQAKYNFEVDKWTSPPLWGDHTKFSMYRHGSGEHIQGTKAFLEQVCLCVTNSKLSVTDEWPTVVPNNSEMVEFLNGMGYHSASSSPTTNPFAFLFGLYRHMADRNSDLEK